MGHHARLRPFGEVGFRVGAPVDYAGGGGDNPLHVAGLGRCHNAPGGDVTTGGGNGWSTPRSVTRETGRGELSAPACGRPSMVGERPTRQLPDRTSPSASAAGRSELALGTPRSFRALETVLQVVLCAAAVLIPAAMVGWIK